MTMPHLMNCSHSDDSWCLQCVKAIGEENEKLHAENADLADRLAKSQSIENMWRNESSIMCDELAILAGLARDPRPGWANCVEKIKKGNSELVAALWSAFNIALQITKYESVHVDASLKAARAALAKKEGSK